MAEIPKEEPKEEKPKTKAERYEDLGKKSKKSSTVKKEEFVKQLATREKLERDYKEDHLYVTFNSSPETRRTILARKPNQEEFINILSLSIEASRYEGKLDEKSLARMKEIYSGLHSMAASLSLDKRLDKEFWAKYVSFMTLQNFITELITESQKGSGVTEEEMKSFRD